MTIEWNGKSALVTGAGSGIGAACARSLAASGAFVWVNDLNAEAAAALALEVGGTAIPGDVAEPGPWLNPILESGTLHAVVHSAGYDLSTPVGVTKREDFDQIYRVMLSGPFEITQRLLGPLRNAQGSCVVFIASVHALTTEKEMSAYASAKAGQVAMVKAMAQDLGQHLVRVLAVSPGYIETPLMDAWLASVENRDETLRWVAGLHLLGRLGKADQVASLVNFLASPHAEFINATNIIIDGGLTAQLPQN
jgi:3-hydroxybutyrate dehydrogenase